MHGIHELLMSIIIFVFHNFYFRELLTLFTTEELIHWQDLSKNYEAELRAGTAGTASSAIYSSKTDEGNKRWKDFKIRVVEHVRDLLNSSRCFFFG